MHDKEWYLSQLTSKPSFNQRLVDGMPTSIKGWLLWLDCPICCESILCQMESLEGGNRFRQAEAYRSHTRTHTLEEAERAWYFQAMG
jgi:hypothetical protein